MSQDVVINKHVVTVDLCRKAKILIGLSFGISIIAFLNTIIILLIMGGK
jgi:hypothetical protein